MFLYGKWPQPCLAKPYLNEQTSVFVLVLIQKNLLYNESDDGDGHLLL